MLESWRALAPRKAANMSAETLRRRGRFVLSHRARLFLGVVGPADFLFCEEWKKRHLLPTRHLCTRLDHLYYPSLRVGAGAGCWGAPLQMPLSRALHRVALRGSLFLPHHIQENLHRLRARRPTFSATPNSFIRTVPCRRLPPHKPNFLAKF